MTVIVIELEVFDNVSHKIQFKSRFKVLDFKRLEFFYNPRKISGVVTFSLMSKKSANFLSFLIEKTAFSQR